MLQYCTTPFGVGCCAISSLFLVVVCYRVHRVVVAGCWIGDESNRWYVTTPMTAVRQRVYEYAAQQEEAPESAAVGWL